MRDDEPGPECFSCAHAGPIFIGEPCRLMARGTASQVLVAWEYRQCLASDPNALCREHALKDELVRRDPYEANPGARPMPHPRTQR